MAQDSSAAGRQPGRYLIQLALLLLVYVLATRLGLLLQASFGNVTPLWPASGISVALLWRGGWKWAPVIALGEFANALLLQQPAIAGVSGALAQLAEAGVAVALLRQAGVSQHFDSTRHLGLFIVLGCLLPPLVSASLGTFGLLGTQLILVGQLSSSWFTWWLGDAMGILVVTPFLMLWSRWPFAANRELYRWAALLGLFTACGMALIHFASGESEQLFFLLLPFVALMAVYVGAAGASSLAVLFAVLVLGMNLERVHDDFIAALRIAFVGTSSVTGLLIAAAIAERRRLDRLLGAEQRRALATMRAIADAVICTNPDGRISFLNPAAERLTGWGLDEAAGRAVEDVLPLEPAEDGDGPHPVRQCLASGVGGKVHGMLRTRGNANVAVDGSLAIIPEPATGVGGAVVGLRDVTVERELRARLVHQANHDAITGLGNRYAFDARLRELADQPCRGVGHALLYVDLDQFKLVNDSCGHEAGDRLLAEIARLLASLTDAETYRLGGDEFGVLLANSDEAAALALAEKLRRAVLDYRFVHGELVFTVGASVGVTYFSGGQISADEILSRADIACYMAKDAGRNRIHAYHAANHETILRHTAIQRLSQLQSAMDAGHLQLYCQRIDRLDGGAVDLPCYEVLLRLEEDGKIVGPGEFLPVAERFGLMPFIDHWVVEQTFRFLAENPARPVRLNINLTGSTLNDSGFIDFIDGLRQRYPVDPNQVCFEVTESVAIERLTQAVTYMQRIRDEGYHFALDDFGSGVASFAYLQDLPVDQVKIDGALVRGLADNPANEIIIEALVRLAHGRGIACVAEWIEDADSAARLRALGVKYGQGFHLHRPQALSDVLEARRADTRDTQGGEFM